MPPLVLINYTIAVAIPYWMEYMTGSGKLRINGFMGGPCLADRNGGIQAWRQGAGQT